MLVGLAEARETTLPHSHSNPVLITAEELTYDRNLSVISAQGRVEISTQQQVVLADSVSYHAKQDLLLATGNVMLLDSNGHVAFADYFKLTGTLKQVIAHKVRVFLSDSSLLISSYGLYDSTINRNILYDASYTTCLVCTRQDTPLWRLRTAEVTYDIEQQNIEYQGAWLEMWGIPIIYTPYLSHPGPSVKRRSGFLTPTLGRTRNRGITIRIPYFLALSSHSDLTLEALFSHNDTPVLTAEYRAALRTGVTKNELSITRDKYGKIRGYLVSKTIFNISNMYRITLEIARTTESTPMRYYYGSAGAWLPSRATLEGFGTRSYGAIHGYTFQSLREKSTRKSVTRVFPSVIYSYRGHPVWLGNPVLDGNFLMLHNQNNISFTGGWILPYVGQNGHILTLSTRLRGAVHWLERPMSPNKSWVLPEAMAEWRYPLVRYGEGARKDHSILEPRLMFTVGSPHKIASHIVFHETDLFAMSHFAALCPVATGPQLSYGLKISQYDNNNNMGRLSLVIGQRYSVYPQKNCGTDSRFANHFSDLVGQVNIISTRHLSLLYRFRVNTNDLTIRYNELNMNVGPKNLQLGIDYAFLDRSMNRQTTMNDHHELVVNLTSAVTPFWTLQLSGRYSLHPHSHLLSGEISARYEDECFLFRGIAARHNTRGRTVQAGGLSIALEFSFKALANRSSE